MSGAVPWLLSLAAACSLPPAPDRDTGGSAEHIEDHSPDPHRDAAVSERTSAPPTCLPSRGVEQVIATDDGATACLGAGANAVRTCWSIRSGGVVGLPLAAWPAPLVETSATAQPISEILAPAGWTATASEAEWGIDAVDVCAAAGCQRIALARTREDDLNDSIATVAIAPDGKRVAIDRGLSELSGSRVELYSLDPVKRLRTLSVPRWPCTNLVGWIGPALVAEGFNCRDWGGGRALFDRDGRRLAVIEGKDIRFAPADPVLALPDDRAMFIDGYQLAIYDLRTGKLLRHLRHPLLEGQYPNWASTDAAVTPTGTVVIVEHDGQIAIVDDQLRVTARLAIPSCPDRPPR